MISLPIFLALADPFDQLASELEIEFRNVGCPALGRRFVHAEVAASHWKARIAERHLGTHPNLNEEQLTLQRVAIIGVKNGRWFAAACLVDGDGAIEELLWLRRCDSQSEAREAFWSTH